jgi:predicted  nucleic acid-binding Zn-ribbon protein
MPTSIDPPLADDEIECARCGARFHYDLTRCPNCGVNLYEPEDDPDGPDSSKSRSPGVQRPTIGDRLEGFVRRFTKKPYPVDTLFGAALNQAELFEDLLNKVGGDRDVVERLIQYEQQQAPQGTRILWLKNAIQRWEKDNQTPGSKI